MLIFIAFAGFAFQNQEPSSERTAAIYRCPAAEAESRFFEPLAHSSGFDAYCIEPAPKRSALNVLRAEKLRSIASTSIDTAANLAWRNATMSFLNGKISPKEWLLKTSKLGETVHFLSSPKTPALREETGKESMRAVQAEMFVLALPGRSCFTADDIWQTRQFPGPGALESWILAMNDYLGPLLYFRHQWPTMVYDKPKILRADAKPGLLVIRYDKKDKHLTIYINTGIRLEQLPPLDLGRVSISKGLDVEESFQRLAPHGIVFENFTE